MIPECDPDGNSIHVNRLYLHCPIRWYTSNSRCPWRMALADGWHVGFFNCIRFAVSVSGIVSELDNISPEQVGNLDDEAEIYSRVIGIDRCDQIPE